MFHLWKHHTNLLDTLLHNHTLIYTPPSIQEPLTCENSFDEELLTSESTLSGIISRIVINVTEFDYSRY